MKKPIAVLALISSMSLAAAASGIKDRQQMAKDSDLPAEARQAMNSIDAEKIRAAVKYLADDKLEGRGTGQRGGDQAADWLAAQFHTYGVTPAGDNGTFFQNIKFFGITTDQQKTRLRFVPKTGDEIILKFGDHFVATNESHEETAEIDAPLVFVGYGINAPEYKWDDYKGADLKGKVLLMLVNEPPSDDPAFFKGKALTYYGRWTYKYEEAARRGAVGAILVHTTEMASYGWDVVRNSWSGESSFLQDEKGPRLKSAGWIQLEIARRLAQAAGMDIDQMMKNAVSRSFKPVELPVRVKEKLVSRVRQFSSRNVVGKVAGSDPQLAKQAVFYTAHYDHLGIHPDEPGDNIYNGAADNATGCGILLELARVYAAAKKHPKRSIFFAAVTAEEQGLLGSKYLGEHPPVPARDISLDLNYDDIQPFGEPEHLVVTGAERTDVYPVVERVAKDFGMAIQPDRSPEAGHYYRSDHFSMARVGVPAFSVNEGALFKGHELAWGEAKERDYVANRYHQPSDEYKPEMDFTADAKLAKFGLALGWEAADASGLVGWQTGDEFEKARLASQGSSGHQ
ncbi:MAG TPA: M28 family metallopeptidase [Candidatus Saccharimonadales bacterium]|jgi:Zn-dependent M28 family amino/carboxypeptidase|nr:M28 family metallopeptidase [Candidatus Saccharimonadales bacterium]